MQKQLEKWMAFEELDESLRQELEELQQDPAALEDAFYDSLSFGTGGIRGKLGPGPNRMNLYTVRKTAEGLARYLKKHTVNYEDRGVVVAYDSRHLSRDFAFEVAKVLGRHQIKSYVFQDIQPTPLLSFAVRHLRTVAGIMITASHNPPEYNGLKVYNEAGSQITAHEAEAMMESMHEVVDELQVETARIQDLEASGLLQILYDEIGHAYMERLLQETPFQKNSTLASKDLSIVFTPLHGTATHLVSEGLKRLQFETVQIVQEQAKADPDFSTVESPNPEEFSAFELAVELGEKVQADILLATDPDADRLGVVAKNSQGQYEPLTGNQLGALLLDFILAHTDERLLANGRIIKTIVTSELGRAIASSYGVQTIDTLTGFKYIGEKINEFDRTGETFLFGYEESYGYLMTPFVRDKDGVHTAMMTCQLAQYWKDRGKNLHEALELLYDRHGYYKEGVASLTLEGKAGAAKIRAIVDRFRHERMPAFGQLSSLYQEDYLSGVRIDLGHPDKQTRLSLPKENVVKYLLEDQCWLCLRPSGTEPKLKWYFAAYGRTKEEVEERFTMLQDQLHAIIVEETHHDSYAPIHD